MFAKIIETSRLIVLIEQILEVNTMKVALYTVCPSSFITSMQGSSIIPFYKW